MAANLQGQAGLREYGVPLMPAELDLLEARADAFPEISEAAEAYGRRHAAEFGGVFVDHVQGTVAVFLTGQLETHRAELGRILRPGAPFEVRQARTTLAELEALADRIEAESEWFRTVDAHNRGTAVRVDRNKVEVRVTTTNPKANDEILAHFGGPNPLEIKADVIRPWTGGVGALVIQAVDPDGNPVSDLDCEIEPDDVNAYQSGDMGWLTNEAGICRIPGVGATGYDVRLVDRSAGSDKIVGVGRVVVSDGLTTSIEVVIRRP